MGAAAEDTARPDDLSEIWGIVALSDTLSPAKGLETRFLGMYVRGTGRRGQVAGSRTVNS
jgi:hypothetical protein